MRIDLHRRRDTWYLAVIISLLAGVGVIGSAAASTDPAASVFVPVSPCRLFDTRPEFQVGSRATPLGADESHTVTATGASGDCNLPAGISAVTLNVTAVGATAPTFLTVYPADVTRPDASHLNPSPGQPPTPNAVNTGVSPTGRFSVYNLAGEVHVFADVVGYFVEHDHDDRYYTKSQSDGRYAAKADVGSEFTSTVVIGPGPGAGDRLEDVAGTGDGGQRMMIYLEPGTYLVDGFEIAPGVSIAGAGRGVTTIETSNPLTVSGFAFDTTRLADLSLRSSNAEPVLVTARSARLDAVEVFVPTGGNQAGIVAGGPMEIIDSDLTISRFTSQLPAISSEDDLTILGSRLFKNGGGWTIWAEDADVRIRDSVIESDYGQGIYFDGDYSSLSIDGSEIIPQFGSTAIEVDGVNANGAIANSTVYGNLVAPVAGTARINVSTVTWWNGVASGSVVCRGVATGAVFHDTTCPS
jgi:hypothetical protein